MEVIHTYHTQFGYLNNTYIHHMNTINAYLKSNVKLGYKTISVLRLISPHVVMVLGRPHLACCLVPFQSPLLMLDQRLLVSPALAS